MGRDAQWNEILYKLIRPAIENAVIQFGVWSASQAAKSNVTQHYNRKWKKCLSNDCCDVCRQCTIIIMYYFSPVAGSPGRPPTGLHIQHRQWRFVNEKYDPFDDNDHELAAEVHSNELCDYFLFAFDLSLRNGCVCCVCGASEQLVFTEWIEIVISSFSFSFYLLIPLFAMHANIERLQWEIADAFRQVEFNRNDDKWSEICAMSSDLVAPRWLSTQV